MKNIKIYLLTLLMVTGFAVNATTYQTVTNGNWNSSSTWTPSKPSFSYGSCDTVIVSHTINMNKNLTSYGVFIIASSGSLSNSSKNLTIGDGGTFTNNGSVSVKNFKADWGTTTITNSGTISVAGNMNVYEGTFTNSGTINVTGNFTNQYDSYFTNSSTGAITVGGNFKNYEEFTNNGTLTVTGSVKNDWGCTMTNTGTISSGSNFTNNGTMTSSGGITVSGNFKNSDEFTNSSTLTVTGSVTNDWSCTMSNTGTISAGTDFNNKGSLTTSGTITAGDDYTNSWGSTLNNSGSITTTDDFVNQGTITNSNTINIGDDMTNDWGCTINNTGSIAITDDAVNNGTVHNNGLMEVDGNYSGSGDTDGTGSLCNSDGVTDPTGGAKGVSCPICGDAGTLPVEIVEISVENHGFYNTIRWTTASEINNDRFEILKSVDGYEFETIGNIKGAGNSNTLKEYQFDDNQNTDAGTVYYRLKQIDYDGTVSYSKIIKVVNTNSLPEVNIYPNPVKSGSDLNIRTTAEGVNIIEIYNSAGSLIKSFSTTEKHIQINMANLPNGMYYIKIINNNKVITKKVDVF